MNEIDESGAIVIEATLSLTVFMFVLLTVYSMFHICLAQARIGVALNETAKEISQYSYLYSLTDLNSKQANLAANGGVAKSTLSDNLSQVDGIYDAFKGLAGTFAEAASSSDNAESFLYYALDAGLDRAKGELTGVLARNLMKKHFGSNPDKFLEGLGVKGGLSQLSFFKTTVFESGTKDDILLDVRYKVTVVKLLGFDLSLNFEQCAKTKAWTASD